MALRLHNVCTNCGRVYLFDNGVNYTHRIEDGVKLKNTTKYSMCCRAEVAERLLDIPDNTSTTPPS